MPILTTDKIFNQDTELPTPYEVEEGVTMQIEEGYTVEITLPEGATEESEIRVMF